MALSPRLGRLGRLDCPPYQGLINARSRTCSSTTFGGLGRNETGRLLGWFTARPSWLPAVSCPVSPRGNDISERQNLPAATSESTKSGLRLGPGSPPPPRISGHPSLGAGAAWGLGERAAVICRARTGCLAGAQRVLALTGCWHQTERPASLHAGLSGNSCALSTFVSHVILCDLTCRTSSG